MKKNVLILVFFLTQVIYAQVPPGFNYQGLIRGSDGKLLPFQQIGVRFSILHGGPDGEPVYAETQTGRTNENGLINLIIGFGDSQDDFSAIDWSDVPYYIKVETDPAGGINYSFESTALLTSVPYASYSGDASYCQNLYSENQNGKLVAYLGESNNSNGYLRLSDKNGNSLIEGECSNDSLGYLGTYSSSGRNLVSISYSADDQHAGYLSVHGANGFQNIALGHPTGSPNHGYLAALNASGDIQAGMYVDENGKGVLFADIKNFSVPYPGDNTRTINYASIEGPEAAVYFRGTANLTNGTCRITLPEHFQLVGSEQNITVLITPLSELSKGLAVVKKSTTEITVTELFSGTGNYPFDYEIKTLRKGYENYQVIRTPLKISEADILKNSSLKSAPILKQIKSDNF